MRVLGIVGSPRKNGNTDILVEESLRGAASAGAETEKVLLADLRIGPCRACEACKRGECVQEDDMPALLEKMFAADAWALGTPVYWWGPSAQMKAFIDRWYAADNQPARRTRMAKRVALITPYADAGPETARHLVGMLGDALAYLGADFAEKLLVDTVGPAGEVKSRPEALQQAFDLGVRLARGL
jgi:multimeric flavodoxin WrbA